MLHHKIQVEKIRDAEVTNDFEYVRGPIKIIMNSIGILKHATNVYMHVIFKMFQEKFKQSLSVHVISSNIDDHLSTLTF